MSNWQKLAHDQQAQSERLTKHCHELHEEIKGLEARLRNQILTIQKFHAEIQTLKRENKAQLAIQAHLKLTIAEMDLKIAEDDYEREISQSTGTFHGSAPGNSAPGAHSGGFGVSTQGLSGDMSNDRPSNVHDSGKNSRRTDEMIREYDRDNRDPFPSDENAVWHGS